MNSFVNERDKYQLNLFPKVASTTFKTWFWYDLEGRHDEFISNPPPFPADRDGMRIRIHQLVNPLAVRDPDPGDDYQVFTVARNPFSRLVSAYWSVIKSDDTRERHMARWKLTEVGDSFAEFVELLFHGKMGRNAHWEPMSNMRGPVGDILRVENLAEDFARMCEKLGKTKGQLPRYYSGRYGSKRATAYYTEEAAGRVRQLYAADFERFGYSTEVPDSLAPRPTGRPEPTRRGRIDEVEELENLDLRAFAEGLDHDSSRRLFEGGFRRGRWFYRQLVRKWGFVELGSVLDVGCGFGRWSVFLAEVNDSLYGIDRQPDAVAIAARLSEHLGLGNASYEVADAAAVPREAESIDGAWCYALLRLVDRAALLREMHRLLAPGGALLLGAVASTGLVLQRFFDGFTAGGLENAKARTALKMLQLGPLADGRPSYATPETIEEVLGRYGFELCPDHPVQIDRRRGDAGDAWATELADLPAFAARLEADEELAARFARHPEVVATLPWSVAVRARKR